jgi:hypothetical protein
MGRKGDWLEDLHIDGIIVIKEIGWEGICGLDLFFTEPWSV